MRLYIYSLITLASINFHNAYAGFSSLFKSCDSECTQTKLCTDPRAEDYCHKYCFNKLDKLNNPYMNSCKIERTKVAPAVSAPVNPVSVVSVNQAVASCRTAVNELRTYQEVTLSVIKQRFKEDSGSPKIAYIQAMRSTIESYITTKNAHLLALQTQGANSSIMQKEITTFANQCHFNVNAIIDFAMWAQGRVPEQGFKTVAANQSKQAINDIFKKRMDGVLR